MKEPPKALSARRNSGRLETSWTRLAFKFNDAIAIVQGQVLVAQDKGLGNSNPLHLKIPSLGAEHEKAGPLTTFPFSVAQQQPVGMFHR